MKCSKYKKVFRLLLIATMFSGSVFAREGIRLTNGEWPPYTSQFLLFGGFASHLVSEAFAEVGVDVEYGYYPWKRSYQYALKGVDEHGSKWNGTIVWVKTDERQKSFLYSDPVITDDEVLFYLKSRPVIWRSVKDLKGKVLGGTAHTYYPILDKAHKDGIITFQRGGNYDSLLKRVYHKRIDAAPLVKHVGLYFLDNTFNEEDKLRFDYSPTILQTRRYHLILSNHLKENERLVKKFNQGLRRLHESGRYQEMYQDLIDGKYSMHLK